MTLCIFAALKFISEVIFILYRTTVMANKDEYIGILIGTYTCPLINSVISHDLE